jgi:hypothetical protein
MTGFFPRDIPGPDVHREDRPKILPEHNFRDIPVHQRENQENIPDKKFLLWRKPISRDMIAPLRLRLVHQNQEDEKISRREIVE